ncbi:MAG TPA: retropepsin-like aspartic protease [Pyrinomonadaceae bacterium]|jgi:hypothetical protein|nr:retropepsin-like aspartic protease [Pyrinomonadaceae bacterium]
MSRLKVLLCAGIIGLMLPALTFAQSATRAAMLSQKTVVDVPLIFNGPTPSVEVTVNGQGPFVFEIDTGAGGGARMDASLKERLGLKPVGQAVAGDPSGKNTRTIDLFKLDSLSLGGVQFHDVETGVGDYNRMPNMPHIDGVLGFSLFAEYLLTMDYPGKRLRLEQGALPQSNGADILSYETDHGIPSIEMEVGGLKVNAHIDSGNMRGGFTLPGSLVEKLALAAPPRVVGRGRTMSNEFEIKEATLKGTLRWGRYEFNEPPLTFIDIFKVGNIGSKVLKEFALTFDQKNHRVRLVRQNTASAPTPG